MMVKEIDAAILSRCTKFSHKLQRATGLTCYFVAKVGLFMSGSNCILEILNHYHKFLRHETPVIMVALSSFLVFIMFVQSLVLTRADEKISDIKPSVFQPRKHDEVWRLIWVVGSCWDIFFFAYGIHASWWYKNLLLEGISRLWFSEGNAIFYYFITVDPLPPCKSKLKAWLEKFSMRQVPVRSE